MIAVLSDIHGNLEAFVKVIRVLNDYKISKIYVLGDFVDYGADSRIIIKILVGLSKKYKIICCRGNHEDSIITSCSKFSTSHAFESISKTREEVMKSDVIDDFTNLSKLVFIKEKVDKRSISMSHGNWIDLSGDYGPVTPIDTRKDYDFSEFTKIIIGGHTHVQGFSKLDYDTVYVNPGSVGQPRNNDPRSQFLICDDKFSRFKFIRTDYDINKAAEKILRSGRPLFLATRLYLGI